MKNLLLIFGLLLTGLVFYSCSEESFEEDFELTSTNEVDLRAGGKIGVKVKPFRKIKKRPRDGKECDCKACFGLCDWEVTVSYEAKPDFYDGDLDINTNTLTFTESLPHKDKSDFVIDEDVSVDLPASLIDEHGYSNITIKSGKYEFIETNSELGLGEVVLDIDYTY